jgi:rubrerythrin
MLRNVWNRRSFLGRTAIGTGAVIAGSTAIELLSTTRAWAVAEGTDGDILNFALTLEYLESTFYEQGNAANVITDSREKDIFSTIQKDEEAHVAALTDTLNKLGVAPVAKPTITFPAGAFASRDSYLKLAMVFENTGVGAYLGQAGSITNKDILQAAAGIFGIEARHAALVGVISGATPEGGVYKGATETAIAKADVLTAVTPFLAGMPNTGIAPAPDSVNFLPAGLAIGGAAAALVAFRTRGSRVPAEK